MNKIWDLEQHKGKIALQNEYGEAVTYDELIIKCSKLTEIIGHRCLVFSLCRNEIGSVLGYVSFVNNGIVPVMLNSRIDEALLQNLLEIYSPEYLWIPNEQVFQFEKMDRVYETYDYVLLRTCYERKYSLFDELALLVTTSGSTGSPKLVRQSYNNLKENAKSIATYLQLNDTEKPITTLPMNYVYGMSIINSHLLVGARILLTDRGLMQKEFWSFFKEARATSFGGVPYTYEMLDKLRFWRMTLPSLRTMTQAGGKITPELHEKIAVYSKEQGVNFVVMYGASEATARMGYLPPERTIEKKGSMGIPIPGGKFTLIDEIGNEILEPFTTGELVYEGKNVSLGYASCGEDLNKGDEHYGKLKTGDMAQFDQDGYYYIVGRKKRFLKIFGNRVNLDEIDRLIKSKFEIEVASVGRDDNMYIFVTSEELVEDIRKYIVHTTGLNTVAFEIKVIDEIPKNDSGKILYKELTKYYEE